MERQLVIEKRLDQILGLWLKVKGDEREQLLMERIRLGDELDRIKDEVAQSA